MMGCLCGLGDTSAWWRLYALDSDVYLWRAKIKSDPPKAPEDALVILAAAMRGANAGLDARGVCVYATEGGNYAVDVVMTVRSFAVRTEITGWSAESIAAAVVADGGVRAAMPNLKVDSAEWLQLTGPPQAIDFWRAHEVLWDYALGPSGGAPTQAFADVRGVYKSPADEGPNAQPWKPSDSPLGPPDGGQTDGKGNMMVVWAAGIGLAVLGVYMLSRKEQRR
jgi:hypothetical protein